MRARSILGSKRTIAVMRALGSRCAAKHVAEVIGGGSRPEESLSMGVGSVPDIALGDGDDDQEGEQLQRLRGTKNCGLWPSNVPAHGGMISQIFPAFLGHVKVPTTGSQPPQPNVRWSKSKPYFRRARS